EYAGGVLVRAVAEEEAVPGVAKVDPVQARQGVGQPALPLQAAVPGEQQDAHAAAPVRQLFPARDPAEEGGEEVDRTEGGPDAGRLPLPGPAAVDGVPDDAVVADGPTLLAVEELDGLQGRVREVAQVARPRRRR